MIRVTYFRRWAINEDKGEDDEQWLVDLAGSTHIYLIMFAVGFFSRTRKKSAS
jgi:hypothetical protein